MIASNNASTCNFDYDIILFRYPIPSMYGIFAYIYHKSQVNVGKYTSPMDGMGMFTYRCREFIEFFNPMPTNHQPLHQPKSLPSECHQPRHNQRFAGNPGKSYPGILAQFAVWSCGTLRLFSKVFFWWPIWKSVVKSHSETFGNLFFVINVPPWNITKAGRLASCWCSSSPKKGTANLCW